ncbi:hypothetical protein BC936DRAFT_143981 [Jimgerdemannia flammicorona]|uniref:Uncharacterized protein n=1 Tax=Jimgerdemannia flammicorona TaxID=994334 RepID=A0A433DD78_9FUNG|nr:hypothetical protein BC936DRAFT_143981 [Jimgerdemannia flammicorona]
MNSSTSFLRGLNGVCCIEPLGKALCCCCRASVISIRLLSLTAALSLVVAARGLAVARRCLRIITIRENMI